MLQNDPLWKTVFYGWSFACYTAICHGAVACTMPKRLVDHNANILSSSKKFAYILYSFFAALFPTPPGSLHSPLSLGAGANAFSHFYVIIHFSFLCFQLSRALKKKWNSPECGRGFLRSWTTELFFRAATFGRKSDISPAIRRPLQSQKVNEPRLVHFIYFLLFNPRAV